MLILERSVTAPFWSNVYVYLCNRLDRDEVRPVGNTGVVNIIDSDRYTSYAVLANDLPVAWLYLTRKAGWAAWEVLQVFVFPELRGHGLASKIYKAAVNHDGILLASGKTQSKSSRKLWKQLIETNAFHVWAQDFKNLDLRAGVEYYDDELYCELPVYTRDATKHDVRFVAHRR